MRMTHTIAMLMMTGAGVASLNAGDIAKLYQQQEGDRAFREITAVSPKGAPSTPQIREIGIERIGSWPYSPCYEATVTADGKVIYRGYGGVEHHGVREGVLHRDHFKHLAQLMTECKVMERQSTYYRGASDTPKLYLYLCDRDTRKVIWCDRSAAPATLWAIGTVIDEVLEQTNWGNKKRRELLRGRLSEHWVKGLDCEDLDVTKAYDALQAAMIPMDSQGEGVRFVFAPPALPPSEGKRERRVTVKFSQVSWLDAIAILCRVCRLSYRVDDDWVTITGDRTEEE